MREPEMPEETVTDLNELIKQAVAKYEAMTPLEKARMHYEQRRSYVRGELMLEHEDMTLDQADTIIDRTEAQMGIVKP